MWCAQLYIHAHSSRSVNTLLYVSCNSKVPTLPVVLLRCASFLWVSPMGCLRQGFALDKTYCTQLMYIHIVYRMP